MCLRVMLSVPGISQPAIDHVSQVGTDLHQESLHPLQLVVIGRAESLARRQNLEALEQLRARKVVWPNTSHFSCCVFHLLKNLKCILE